MSGLPYLRKLSLDDFKISVILSFRVLKYGNISQKSWKLNTRTFSFQASCAWGVTAPHNAGGLSSLYLSRFLPQYLSSFLPQGCVGTATQMSNIPELLPSPSLLPRPFLEMLKCWVVMGLGSTYVLPACTVHVRCSQIKSGSSYSYP